MIQHTLVFLEPGHFHAALTLRERHPLARDEVFVYTAEPPGTKGGEVREFLDLVTAFNQRPERPTMWRAVVRSGPEPLTRLLHDRPGDVAILAGRNDRKMALARQLHDAGIHVLADKPWMTSPTALPDVRHVLSGGPRAMEMMTGRLSPTSRLMERLVREPRIFGTFDTSGEDGVPISLSSVHHLEKLVNGVPLRRPPWFFDVRVQGNGLADIPTHLVDQVQRLLAPPGSAALRDARLFTARHETTAVPRELFSRVTGVEGFPAELRSVVNDDVLAYAGNAALELELRGVEVSIRSRWEPTEPTGGGDEHHAMLVGTMASVRLQQGPATGFRRSLTISPRRGGQIEAALSAVLAAWQHDFPGIAATPIHGGFEIVVPALPGTAHESQFPLVLDEFLCALEGGPWPDGGAADTLAKYELLARALSAAPTA
jgi:predicted dehydrogenase